MFSNRRPDRLNMGMGLRPLSCSCSKEWSGTRADFQKKKHKLEKSIRLLLRKHRDTDDDEGGGPRMRDQEQRAIERLRNKATRIEKWLGTDEDKKGPGVRSHTHIG